MNPQLAGKRLYLDARVVRQRGQPARAADRFGFFQCVFGVGFAVFDDFDDFEVDPGFGLRVKVYGKIAERGAHLPDLPGVPGRQYDLHAQAPSRWRS